MIIRRLLAPLVDRAIAFRFHLEFRLRGSNYRMPIERAARICAKLCERELRLHGVSYSRNADHSTFLVDRGDGYDARLNTFNVTRRFAKDGNIYPIIDLVESTLDDIPYLDDWPTVRHRVFWTIQSNSLADQSDLATHLSDQTHRVPAVFVPEAESILWLSSHALIGMKVTEAEVAEAADLNLAAELERSELIVRQFQGVRYGVINSPLPFKAALILAPNLRDVVEPVLGWPLFGVIPRRDFMYLYDARCFENGASDIFDKLPGLGAVVLEEYELGANPLSTEIFEITDEGVRAVAEYRRNPPSEAEAQIYGEIAGTD